MRISHAATVLTSALILALAPSATAAPPSDSPEVPAGDIAKTGGANRTAGGRDGDKTADLRDSVEGRDAKNVILLIGDGMGTSEITSARNYQHGAAGTLPGLDALPITGEYTTFALTKDGSDRGKPDYVTDSAASGTGWATGTKTYNGAISVDLDGKPLDTILEIVQKQGFATGNVTTAELQDATPAVLTAHVTDRDCKGPKETAEKCAGNAIENGGKGSISEQLVATRADISLGGGGKYFDESIAGGEHKGKTSLEVAKAAGYQLPTTAADLNKVDSLDTPVLGVFGKGNLPVQWDKVPAAVPNGGKLPATTCRPNPELPKDQPQLSAMTSKAIDLLVNSKRGKDKGFFLQVESASIDKQDHAANICGQIGETIALDEAVATALDFARKDGNTLVIVTADHGHSSLIVPEDFNNPTALSVAVKTADGATMRIMYPTAPEGESQTHTGTQVRIAAYGPGAANVSGLTDQTDNFNTIVGALLGPKSPDASGGPSWWIAGGIAVVSALLGAAAAFFLGRRRA
ncbi:alkaline phosphatase [Mycobacterium sp. NPDC050853]|uniref:alkaline phosphatase n=1 Tax=Mycobacterium sp. NPDC050853 TaxID=3155160 RepID=UPI0033DF622B